MSERAAPHAPGTRVRHVGHQWPEAYSLGTATIVSSRPCGEGYEYVVQRDDGSQCEWANYHLTPVFAR